MAEVHQRLLDEGIDLPNATNMCVTAFRPHSGVGRAECQPGYSG